MKRRVKVGLALVIVGIVAVFGFYQFYQSFNELQGRGWFTTFEIHLLVEHYDKYGNLISRTCHPMTVVDQGKDWIEQQLFNPNASQKALYIGVSNDSSSVDTSWTALPNEITSAGLSRKEGTYTSTGVGSANVTVTFSVTGTASTKLYGIYYSLTGNTLIAAEQQGEANQKNLNDGDTLKITVMWSHG